MTAKKKSIEERVDRLHAGGIVDLHFDLPMDLYEKRERKNVLQTEFLPELEAGNVAVVGAGMAGASVADPRSAGPRCSQVGRRSAPRTS